MAYLKHGSKVPTKGKGSRLTGKQLRFVEEYVISLDAGEAVLKAGYVTRNQHRIAVELMQHPLVKAEIDKRLAAREERMSLTADYVLTKIQSIVEKAHSDEKLNEALRGLELLGKHLALFRERQEISGPDGGAIEYEKKMKEEADDLTSRIAQLASRRGAGRLSLVSDNSSESAA